MHLITNLTSYPKVTFHSEFSHSSTYKVDEFRGDEPVCAYSTMTHFKLIFQVSLISNVGTSAFEKLAAFEPVLKRHGIIVTRKILFEEAATAQDMLNGGQLEEIRANSRSGYSSIAWVC